MQTNTEVFAKRLERINDELLTESCVARSFNGYEVPAEPKRFLMIELSSGEEVWASDADDLSAIAKEIDESDTDREQVKVYDLDSGTEYWPTMKVVSFLNCDDCSVIEVTA